MFLFVDVKSINKILKVLKKYQKYQILYPSDIQKHENHKKNPSNLSKMKRRKSLPEKKEPEKQQIEVSSNLITNVQKETNLENPQINYYLEQFLKQDFSAYIKQKQIEENQIKKLEKTPPPKKSPSVLISRFKLINSFFIVIFGSREEK